MGELSALMVNALDPPPRVRRCTPPGKGSVASEGKGSVVFRFSRSRVRTPAPPGGVAAQTSQEHPPYVRAQGDPFIRTCSRFPFPRDTGNAS